MPELNDHELLAQFSRQNSQAAFAALVARYVNLVYSVGLRKTGNAHAAEEITQAVFVILARKAAGLSSKTILSGGLCETARLTAANYLRTEIRRQKREQEAYVQSLLNEPQTDEACRQIAPLLDDAIGKLNHKDRSAVVLRFFENRSLGEVGHALGASEDAAKMRVNRALEKLRKIFGRRGVTLTAAIIAGAISANSIQAAPMGLAATVSATTASGSIVAVSTLTLVKGVLKIMAWMKLKPVILVGAAILLAGGTATVVTQALAQKQNAETGANQQYIRPGFQNMFSKERFADLKANVWPKEREAEIARIKARQRKNETTNAVTINLRSFINTALTESAASPIGVNDDNLGELPSGVHTYAGVPFDVQGSIQLMGTGMTRYNKMYPSNVSDIPINRRCFRLYVLHGSNWTYMNAFGQTVAKLVLHYEDGSEKEINMVAGQHVFDWWFPLFKTGLNPRHFKMAPGTERAWTGRNKFIDEVWPGESLILYKSTFTNPQPDVVVSSIDYVSTMTLTAPFMVGLTVE